MRVNQPQQPIPEVDYLIATAARHLASNVQVRQPLYRSSLGRWRHYEAYLGPLLAELNADGR